MENLRTRKDGKITFFLSLMLFCIFFITPNVIGQTAVYIDPTFSGSPKNGTQTNPLNDIPAMVSNTTYLIKGGTTLTTSNPYSANANNVKISTYGTGRAYIVSSYTGNVLYLDGNGNSYENLDVTSTTTSQTGASVLNFRIEGGTCTINNCITTGGLQGVAINNYYGGTGVARITNCTMHATQRDGNYIDDLDSLIFKNNHVYDVNRNVLLDIGGDCLQTETVKYVVVDNCTMDHSSAGGKFALINNGYINVWVSNSTFIGAENSASGGSSAACIYTGGGDKGNMFYYITNCKLSGAMRSIQNRADLLELKNVVMKGTSTTLFGIDGTTALNAYNCDFIDLPTAISSMSWTGTRVIKNSIFYNVPDGNYVQLNNTTGSNNISNNAVSAAQKTLLGSDVRASTDPLFINYTGSDFRLQSGSPCKDHGADISLSFDIVNTPRPIGAVDIGAYEYFATETTPPSAPANLISSNISSTAFNLSWTASTDNTGVAGYNIYKDGVVVTSSSYTSASVTGLTPGTTYSITVRAVDLAGNTSSASTPLDVITLSDTQAPTMPAGLASTNVMGDGFTLSWTASTDNVAVAGYDVYKDGVLATSVTSTTASLTGLSVNTTYTLTVKAKDGSGNVSAASNALNVTTSDQVIISANGTGTIWQSLSASTDNTGATTSAGINNGNLTSDVIFNDASGSHFYQGAGIVWPAAQVNITSVKFYNGAYNAGTSNGYFEANVTLQASVDGTTWTDVNGWTCSPAYPYTSTASNKIYTFTGSGLSNVKGIRVVGQVRSSETSGSWAVAVKEIQVTMSGGSSDSQAPTVPTGLASSNITMSGFSLSWTASTDNVGVTGYDILVNGSVVNSVGAITSASITGLNLATTYSVTVKARDASGNVSAASLALNVTTGSDTQAPNAPTGLVSSAVNCTGFTLSWTASTDNVGVAGYDIYQNGLLVSSVTGTSALFGGLTPLATYVMMVKAKDAAGNVSDPSTSLNITTISDTIAPVAPTGLVSGNVLMTSFTLSWIHSTDNIGVTGYDIMMNGSLFTSVGTTTSVSITGLNAATLYNLTVRAKDAAGNTSVVSLALNVTTASDSQAPTVPTGLASGNITSSGFTLSWSVSTDNAGVTGYDVYNNGILVNSVTASSVTLSGLASATTYAMSVKAKDAAGNVSSASAALNVTTSPINTLPSPWLTQDVGAVGVAGSAIYNNGTFSLVGSGTDIWDDIDQFRFVYQTLSGDGEIKARVVSQTNSNAWAKAGVMVRESLATGAKEAATVVTPGNGVSFQRRLVTNSGAGYSTKVTGYVAPLWVKIARSGSTITSYYSTNGTTWTLIGTDNITMTTAYIGLCVSSHANTTTSTGIFDNVTVTSPLKSADVADGINTIKSGSVLIYPNPASDEVNVELSSPSIVKLIDINGKLRFIKPFEAGKTNIQLNLESGLYIIQIQGEDGFINTSKLQVN